MSQLVRLRGTQTAQTAHCALYSHDAEINSDILIFLILIGIIIVVVLHLKRQAMHILFAGLEGFSEARLRLEHYCFKIWIIFNVLYVA